jgi:hypothetical protein
MMKALKRFLFKPLEYLLLLGFMMVVVQLLFHPLSVPEAWTLSLSPALIWLGIFCLAFSVLFFATWISSSSTEM